MAEAGDERAESLFDLVLPGGGDASESPTVERIESGDDFESALGIAEATSEFEEAFVGFGSGVAEEDLAGADELDEGESEMGLGSVMVEVGGMDEGLGLLDESVGDCRMSVAEGADGDAAAEVEVVFAGEIPELAAGTVAEGQVEASVGGHDILGIECADVGVLILDDVEGGRSGVSHLGEGD